MTPLWTLLISPSLTLLNPHSPRKFEIMSSLWTLPSRLPSLLTHSLGSLSEGSSQSGHSSRTGSSQSQPVLTKGGVGEVRVSNSLGPSHTADFRQVVNGRESSKGILSRLGVWRYRLCWSNPIHFVNPVMYCVTSVTLSILTMVTKYRIQY